MFVDKVRIVKIEDFCGKEPPFSTDAAQYDKREVGLQVRVEVKGLDFALGIYVGGNINRSATTENKKWGSAWKVREMLRELGISTQTAMKVDHGVMSFIDEEIQKAIGKEFFKISYKTLNGKRREYDRIVSQRNGETEDEAKDRLIANFNSDVEKGYVKYIPYVATETENDKLPEGLFDKPDDEPEEEIAF
jgi:hypothetical protein